MCKTCTGAFWGLSRRRSPHVEEEPTTAACSRVWTPTAAALVVAAVTAVERIATTTPDLGQTRTLWKQAIYGS